MGCRLSPKKFCSSLSSKTLVVRIGPHPHISELLEDALQLVDMVFVALFAGELTAWSQVVAVVCMPCLCDMVTLLDRGLEHPLDICWQSDTGLDGSLGVFLKVAGADLVQSRVARNLLVEPLSDGPDSIQGHHLLNEPGSELALIGLVCINC